jgi:hypothetical protein
MQVESHLLALAPDAAEAFQQGRSMQQTAFYRSLCMQENAVVQGKMRQQDDSVWSKEQFEQMIVNVQSQVFFPVRPPLFSRADHTAQATVSGPALDETSNTGGIISLNFLTFWIIYRCFSSGNESNIVVRRLNEADAVFGYRHFFRYCSYVSYLQFEDKVV